jgi:hypothetical protein
MTYELIINKKNGTRITLLIEKTLIRIQNKFRLKIIGGFDTQIHLYISDF